MHVVPVPEHPPGICAICHTAPPGPYIDAGPDAWGGVLYLCKDCIAEAHILLFGEEKPKQKPKVPQEIQVIEPDEDEDEDAKDELFFCKVPGCDMAFKRIYDLEQHMRAHRREGDGR